MESRESLVSQCINFVGPFMEEAADPRDPCVTCGVPFENHPRSSPIIVGHGITPIDTERK